MIQVLYHLREGYMYHEVELLLKKRGVDRGGVQLLQEVFGNSVFLGATSLHFTHKNGGVWQADLGRGGSHRRHWWLCDSGINLPKWPTADTRVKCLRSLQISPIPQFTTQTFLIVLPWAKTHMVWLFRSRIVYFPFLKLYLLILKSSLSYWIHAANARISATVTGVYLALNRINSFAQRTFINLHGEGGRYPDLTEAVEHHGEKRTLETDLSSWQLRHITH